MSTHEGPFQDDRLYSPNSAASCLRARSDGGRAAKGPRYFRQIHKDGALPGIPGARGRVLFLGRDLNQALAALRVTPLPPEARISARVAEQLRRESAREPRS